MIALDTSVAIPAVATWHEHHDLARTAAAGAVIPAHALLETFAALTRLPAPFRFEPSVIAELLERRFPPSSVLALGTAGQKRLIGHLDAARISGGASYDALVGLTCAAHGAELLTNDGRARATYEALGVAHRMLSS